MSNVVKRKKLTKRIALRLPHATWRAIAKQARLHGITPSELVREAIEHYQGLEKAAPMAATRKAIGALWQRELDERTASAPPKSRDSFSWTYGLTRYGGDGGLDTPPKAQPPGPPGGAGSASVRDNAGETEVSKSSQRR